ncbi:MAG: DoxX family protein [Ignavibacteriales bacterium]|nr:DoxX family protein [Ignavibacteriales bacterium]
MNNSLINFGLFIFRISISLFMMLGHGLGKFQKLISGAEIKFLDPFGIGATASFSLAVFAEFFAPMFIVLGVLTRFNSLSLIITMSVAAFIAHADDPFSNKEKALLYLASYVLLFFTGPGKFSLQNWFVKKIKNLNGILKFILH